MNWKAGFITLIFSHNRSLTDLADSSSFLVPVSVDNGFQFLSDRLLVLHRELMEALVRWFFQQENWKTLLSDEGRTLISGQTLFCFTHTYIRVYIYIYVYAYAYMYINYVQYYRKTIMNWCCICICELAFRAVKSMEWSQSIKSFFDFSQLFQSCRGKRA